MAENKWLQRHLLHFVLRHAKDALCYFHVWNYDPLSGFHVTTCFHWFFLPCIDDVLVLMGRFVGRMAQELEVPIGSMILYTSYVARFRRNNGQTMISTLHLLSSCGRSHLENLSSWDKHFMDVLIGGVTWVILEDRNILAQDQQQPIHIITGERKNMSGKYNLSIQLQYIA